MRELAARAEAVQAGLGVLVGVLAGLAGELTGEGLAAASFDQIEQRVQVQGRELLRMTVQHVLDVRAAGEPRRADVADARGIARPRAERGHVRTVVSVFGPVIIRRMAYRAAGAANLYPRDAVLNLPPRRYSWAVQERAAGFALETSFEQAGQWLAEGIGTRVHKGQIEQIAVEAARDAEAFCAARAPAAPAPGIPLVVSVDGKGVAMRPEARRPIGYQRVTPTFGKRLGTGEKRGVKRMAEVGVVFDALPPDRSARPAGGMSPISPLTGPSPSAGSSRRLTAAIPPASGPGSPWPTGTAIRSPRSARKPPAGRSPSPSWSTSSTSWNTSGRSAGRSTSPATRPSKRGSPRRPSRSCAGTPTRSST